MRNLDRCEQCQRGRFKIYHTRTRGSSRTRFLKCDHCGVTSKESFAVDHLGRIVFDASTWRGTAIHSPAASVE